MSNDTSGEVETTMFDIPTLADDAPRAEVAAWFDYLMEQVETQYTVFLAKEKAAKKRKQPHAHG